MEIPSVVDNGKLECVPLQIGSADSNDTSTMKSGYTNYNTEVPPSSSSSMSVSKHDSPSISLQTPGFDVKSTFLEDCIEELAAPDQKGVTAMPDFDDSKPSKIDKVKGDVAPSACTVLSSGIDVDASHTMIKLDDKKIEEKSPEENTDHSASSDEEKDAVEDNKCVDNVQNRGDEELEKKKNFTRSKGETSDDEKVSRDAEAESRNNLYWCGRYNCACLWYGNDEVELEDMIEVLPFFQEISDEIIVQRSDIVQLEFSHCERYNDNAKIEFCKALLDFPEWDDHSRPSYIWAAELVALMNENEVHNEWCDYLKSQGLDASLFNGEERKKFLFGMCAQQSGLLGECNKNSLTMRSASSDVLHLYDMIVQFEDNQDVGFRRSASRVGVNFEVGCYPECRWIEKESPVSNEELESMRLEGLVHSAFESESHEIDDYLKKVAIMQLVTTGCIVHAPRSTNPTDRQQTSCGIITKLQVSSSRDMTIPELFKDVGKMSVTDCNSLNSEILVSIYDGNQSWSIPITYCTVYSKLIGQDRALEILRDRSFSTDEAFKEIFVLYNKLLRYPDEYLWSKEQFDAFMSAVMTCKRENLWRVFVIYKKNMRRVILKTERPEKSFKSIYELYERMFPDIDLKDSFGEAFLCNMNRYSQSPTKHSRERQSLSPDGWRSLHANIVGNEGTHSPSLSRQGIMSRDFSAMMGSPKKVGQSNRWPSALKMARNNLYWYRSTASPCICLGLDPASLRNYSSEPLVRIFPIDTTTYLHEIKVTVSSLDTLSITTLESKCHDQRTIDFAKALIDFSAWELEENTDCLWYVFPTFVLEFMKHPPTWSSWRTRTERASRGSKEDRGTIYFNALKEELKEQGDSRCKVTDYPWDDEPVSIMKDLCEEKKVKESVLSLSSTTARSMLIEEKLEMERKRKERDDERKKEAEMRKTLKKIEEEERKARALEKKRKEEELERLKELERRKEQYDSLHPQSMYWLPRMQLPAICLAYERVDQQDSKQGHGLWKLTLKPVCCSTYHYIIDTDRNACEKLTDGLLRQCHDERTVDFTLALMDFAVRYQDDWSEPVSSLSNDMAHSTETIFVWPGYITDLMEEYRQWSVWRKKAERSSSGGGNKRKEAYLKCLLEGFEEYQRENPEEDSDEGSPYEVGEKRPRIGDVADVI